VKVDWKLPMRIEHRVAKIIAAQERAAWQFRLQLAEQRVAELENMAQEIEPAISEMLGHYYVAKGQVDKPFTKSGKLAVRQTLARMLVGLSGRSSGIR